MDILLQELIDMVKNVAPSLWEMALKEVMVTIIQQTVFIILMIAIIIVLSIIIRWLNNKDQDVWDDYSVENALLTVGIAAAATVIVCLISALVGNIINPEYRAINNLILLVK